MKNLIQFIAAVVTIAFMSSCNQEVIRPSDLITTESKYFEDYTKISATGEFEVFVTLSPNEEIIEIEANENLHDRIKIEKSGQTLFLGLENNTSIRGNQTLKAYITTTSLEGFSATGESNIEVLNEVFEANDLDVSLTGESSFKANIEADEFVISLTGGSKVDVTGIANTLDGKLAGESMFKNFGFSSDYVRLNMTGDSQVYTTAEKEIKITATGGSKYHYRGNAAVVSQILTGDAEIKNVN